VRFYVDPVAPRLTQYFQTTTPDTVASIRSDNINAITRMR